MIAHFGLTTRFLDPVFHGRRDGGEAEWPPSPLRAFQALVAAAAATRRLEKLSPALRWLERRAPPILIAPPGITGSGYRLSVPNNAMDVVARAWSRGNESNAGDANPAIHRTMKAVRPTWLRGGDAVHYLWPVGDAIDEEVRAVLDQLGDLARSVVALGCGLDLVVGHGAAVSQEDVDQIQGERWLPVSQSHGSNLRIPRQGTLDDLIERHRHFLRRLGPDGATLTPPPPLSAFASIGYRRATDPPARPALAFALLTPDADRRCSYDTARCALTVAGMVRHAARTAAEQAGWPEAKIGSFVLGHASGVPVGPQRFVYLPLPSIEARGQGKALVVGSVRRVLISAPSEGCSDEIAWARRAVSGQELIDEKRREPVALLSLIPTNDPVVRRYVEPAACWATVTPVVLPGYDDPGHYRRRLERATSPEESKDLLKRLDDRIDGLLRKAIVQAGFSQILAAHAELAWRKVCFWPRGDHADRYGVPDHLRRFPRFHVQVRFRDSDGRDIRIPGPICLGSGRFSGVGLFAALPEDGY